MSDRHRHSIGGTQRIGDRRAGNPVRNGAGCRLGCASAIWRRGDQRAYRGAHCCGHRCTAPGVGYGRRTTRITNEKVNGASPSSFTSSVGQSNVFVKYDAHFDENQSKRKDYKDQNERKLYESLSAFLLHLIYAQNTGEQKQNMTDGNVLYMPPRRSGRQ